MKVIGITGGVGSGKTALLEYIRIHYNCEIILADEPTGNLDSKNSQEIVDLLKFSNKTYNQTLIVITHDENIALQADRIITIEDGAIASDNRIRG